MQRTRASPARVTLLRTVCQAGPSVRPRSSATRARAAAGSRPSSTAAAIVPAAPPICTGKVSAARSSYASRTAVSQVAAFRPKVVGTACWVRVRATVVRPPVGPRQVGEDADLAPQVGGHLLDRPAQAPHQRGVEDVLAGQAAVQPPLGLRREVRVLAEELEERRHRVAGELGLVLDPLDVLVPDLQGAAHGLGRDPAGHQDPEPGLLHGQHRGEQLAAREVVAGAVVAGPEEVRHGISLGDGRGRRSRRRPAAGCRRRTHPRPAPARRVLRRSPSDARNASSAASGR